MVAHKYGIKYIIDDAILIKDNKVICGKSAKTEGTKIASVKSAIFMNEDRRKEMVKVLNIEKPDKIIILGTSDEMVEIIVSKLELGTIFKKIYIGDIVTKESIEVARKSRVEEGKHVVPVPTFEIKAQFSGYFLDPLKVFNNLLNTKEHMVEKTIIRPYYSYLGKYYISEKVINNIIEYISLKISGISKLYRVSSTKFVDGVKIDIDIEIIYGTNIPTISNRLKNAIIKEITRSTGINVFAININVKGISKLEVNKWKQ